MTDTAVQSRLDLTDIATAALAQLVTSSTELAAAVVDPDTFQPVVPGPPAEVAYVHPEFGPQTVKLEQVVDVGVAIEPAELHTPLDAFLSMYVVPGIDAMAAHLDGRIRTLAEQAGQRAVFVSAPLTPVEAPFESMTHTCAGVSLRIAYGEQVLPGYEDEPDVTVWVLNFALLYGLHTPEVEGGKVGS